MFGIARRKSRSQLVREELGESLDHFVQAATLAARGAGETVGPRVTTARAAVTPAAGRVKTVAVSGWGSTVAALAPLATAATSGARQADLATRKAKIKADVAARNAKAKNVKAVQKKAAKKAISNKKSGRNRSKFGTLLIAGAAVGAAGAMVLRRHKQQQWDQYDPSRPIGADSGDRAPVESMLPASMPGDTGRDLGTTATTGTTPTSSPLASEPVGDQTSSPQHSPTVARMAGNTAPDATTADGMRRS